MKRPSKLLIDITDNHIQEGVRNNPRCCPISLALEDKGFNYAFTLGGTAQTDKCKLKLSTSAHKFLTSFDNEEDVKPSKFFLTILYPEKSDKPRTVNQKDPISKQLKDLKFKMVGTF